MHRLKIRNADPHLSRRGFSSWRKTHPEMMAVWWQLWLTPDGTVLTPSDLARTSPASKTVMPVVLPWLEAMGFIDRKFDEITLRAVPRFEIPPPVSLTSTRTIHHINKTPLPERKDKLAELRLRFGIGAVGTAAFELFKKHYDDQYADFTMLGWEKPKLRGVLCELQASGLVNTFASPHQLIYVPWDLPKEQSREAVEAWLKSPDAEPAAHLEPKNTDPKWKRFLDAYKSLAKHFTGTSVVIRKEDIPLAKKLVREHDENRFKLYLVASTFFLYYTDFEQEFEWDIKQFGYSFRTFYKHFEAIAADYSQKRNQVFGGKEYWPLTELRHEDFDYKTEFQDW